MNVKEFIKEEMDRDSRIVDYEIYKYLGKNPALHTDTIECLEDGNGYPEEVMNFCLDGGRVEIYKLDEEAYNTSILVNACINADFNDWYGTDNATVLILVFPFDWDYVAG